MVNKALVSLVALLPVLGSHALAQQHPLAGIHAPQPAALFNEVNFTALFAPASAVDRKSGPVSSWARNSWNGLTTYAGSKPLRCFGEDQEVPYDVAVLGALLYLTCISCFIDNQTRCSIRYYNQLSARVGWSTHTARLAR